MTGGGRAGGGHDGGGGGGLLRERHHHRHHPTQLQQPQQSPPRRRRCVALPYTHEHHRAATEMQRAWRGYSTRLGLWRGQGAAAQLMATRIQRRFRGHASRKHLAQALAASRGAAATTLQCLYRRWHARRAARALRTDLRTAAAVLLQRNYRARLSRLWFEACREALCIRRITVVQALWRRRGGARAAAAERALQAREDRLLRLCEEGVGSGGAGGAGGTGAAAAAGGGDDDATFARIMRTLAMGACNCDAAWRLAAAALARAPRSPRLLFAGAIALLLSWPRAGPYRVRRPGLLEEAWAMSHRAQQADGDGAGATAVLRLLHTALRLQPSRWRTHLQLAAAYWILHGAPPHCANAAAAACEPPLGAMDAVSGDCCEDDVSAGAVAAAAAEAQAAEEEAALRRHATIKATWHLTMAHHVAVAAGATAAPSYINQCAAGAAAVLGVELAAVGSRNSTACGTVGGGRGNGGSAPQRASKRFMASTDRKVLGVALSVPVVMAEVGAGKILICAAGRHEVSSWLTSQGSAASPAITRCGSTLSTQGGGAPAPAPPAPPPPPPFDPSCVLLLHEDEVGALAAAAAVQAVKAKGAGAAHGMGAVEAAAATAAAAAAEQAMQSQFALVSGYLLPAIQLALRSEGALVAETLAAVAADAAAIAAVASAPAPGTASAAAPQPLAATEAATPAPLSQQAFALACDLVARHRARSEDDATRRGAARVLQRAVALFVRTKAARRARLEAKRRAEAAAAEAARRAAAAEERRKRNRCAALVQAMTRMRRWRKAFLAHKSAALTIQCMARCHAARREVAERRAGGRRSAAVTIVLSRGCYVDGRAVVLTATRCGRTYRLAAADPAAAAVHVGYFTEAQVRPLLERAQGLAAAAADSAAAAAAAAAATAGGAGPTGDANLAAVLALRAGLAWNHERAVEALAAAVAIRQVHKAPTHELSMVAPETALVLREGLPHYQDVAGDGGGDEACGGDAGGPAWGEGSAATLRHSMGCGLSRGLSTAESAAGDGGGARGGGTRGGGAAANMGALFGSSRVLSDMAPLVAPGYAAYMRRQGWWKVHGAAAGKGHHGGHGSHGSRGQRVSTATGKHGFSPPPSGQVRSLSPSRGGALGDLEML